MKRYDSYKDSGVEWIGEVPSHWNLCAFKRFMTINNGSDYKHIVSDEGFPVIGSGGPFATASQYMYDGEVVMLGRKGTIDKPMYFNGKFWAVDTMFYAVPSHETNCRFMYYLALTLPFSYYSTATALPSMTQTDLANNPIAVPDIVEQTAIATYLDNKCSKIDNVIATQEKRVELLRELKQSIITRAVTRGINPDVKMKDSGVEWIGEIPEHWEVMKLKYIAFLQSGDTISSTSFIDDGKYPVYGGNGLRGYVNSFTNDGEYALIGRQGALCGNINYAKGKFFASEHAIVVYPINEEPIIWLGEMLKISNLNQYSISAAQPGLSVSVIKNIYYPYPPREERMQIATYIEQQTRKLDRSITKALRQIELLKEYRQSLITEVVTGKRKVC